MLDFGRRSTYRFLTIDGRMGRQSLTGAIAVDRPAFVHSFGMTKRYLILAEGPLVVNPLKLRFRRKPFIRSYEGEPDRGARFHVVEKASGRVVRTGRGRTFFAFHHVNAFEDGGDVVVDIVTHPNAGVIDQIYLDRLRSAEPVTATGRLTRVRIGMQGTVAAEQLSDTLDRRAGQRYRYVYGVGTTAARDFVDSLIKLDLEPRTASSWHDRTADSSIEASPSGSGESWLGPRRNVQPQ